MRGHAVLMGFRGNLDGNKVSAGRRELRLKWVEKIHSLPFGHGDNMTISFRRPPADRSYSTIPLITVLWLTLVGQAHAQLILPTAVDDNDSTLTTTPVTINVLSNDSAGTYPLDPTSVEIVTPPAHGSTSINPVTGAITYTPDPTVAGLMTFGYAVRDTHGNPSYPASVHVTVNHTPPTANADSAVTKYNQSALISVLANDTAGTASIDPASVEIVTQPTRGSVSVNSATGVVTYVPSGTSSGSDSFQYRVSDTQGFVSNTAGVSISIQNNPPDIESFATDYQGNHVVRFFGKVVDEDPASCTVHLGLGLNVDLTPNADGTFSYQQYISEPYGMVSAKATDNAGQSSSELTCWYFTSF